GGSLLLGLILMDSGSALQAEPNLRKALEIQRTFLGWEKDNVADAQSALALCLGYLHRFDEADPLMQSGVETMCKVKEVTSREARTTLGRAVTFYQLWDKPGQVERYRALLRKPASPQLDPKE